MHGIYNYIPETNHVFTVYSVAAVLYLRSVPHVMLFPHEICFLLLHQHFRSLCAVSNRAVFRSSLISCFPSMLRRYCLSDFEVVPVAPAITGINFVF